MKVWPSLAIVVVLLAPASYNASGIVQQDAAIGHIEGRCLVASSDDQLPTCEVFLSRPGASVSRSARADRSGRYRFEGVAVGEYLVTFDGGPAFGLYRWHAVRVRDGDTVTVNGRVTPSMLCECVSRQPRFQVGADGRSVMVRDVVVTGHVENAAGERIPHARLRLTAVDKNPAVVAEAYSGRSGEFGLAVPAGLTIALAVTDRYFEAASVQITAAPALAPQVVRLVSRTGRSQVVEGLDEVLPRGCRCVDDFFRHEHR